MIYVVEHEIEFRYDRPILVEPQLVRLRPRSDAWQRVHAHSFRVTPEPAGLSEFTDAAGNSSTRVWFAHLTDELTFVARSEVEPLHEHPFDFLVSDHARTLPFEYQGRNEDLLARYRMGDADDPAVRPLVEAALKESGGQTVVFLTALNAAVGAACRTVTRPEGDPLPPGETLARGEGACRDLVRVFLAAVRSAGLAGRFVSGYHLAVPEDGTRHLHAWAEVYIPGAGWRGLDPSNGLMVSNQHIWVAAGPTHADCRPAEGTFRGTGIESRMAAKIRIEEREAAGRQRSH